MLAAPDAWGSVENLAKSPLEFINAIRRGGRGVAQIAAGKVLKTQLNLTNSVRLKCDIFARSGLYFSQANIIVVVLIMNLLAVYCQ